MKPIPLIAGGVAGLAILWTAGWFAGKSLYVEPEADKIVEGLRAGDFFFAFEAREISGFPFAYNLAYEGVSVADASQSWRWTAPMITVGSGVSDGGALTLRPSDETELEISAAALGGEDGDAPSLFDVAAKELFLTMSQAENGFDVEAGAEALTVTQKAGAGVIDSIEVTLTGLFVDTEAAGDLAEVDIDAKADQWDVGYRLSLDGVQATTAQSVNKGLSIEFSSNGDWAEGFAAFVANGGEMDFVFMTKSSEGTGESTGGPSSAPMKYAAMAGDAEARFSVRGGRADYGALAEDVTYDFEIDGPSSLPGGALSIEEIEMAFETPLLRNEEPEPFIIQTIFDTVEVDEAVWALFDPNGEIERTPVDLDIDLGGAVLLRADLGAETYGPSPVEVDTLDIKEVAFSGLGVEATAVGALKIAGDPSRPDGNVRIDVSGVEALLESLVSARVFSAEQAGAYRALIDVYALPGDDEDELYAEIEASNGSILLNGKPIR